MAAAASSSSQSSGIFIVCLSLSLLLIVGVIQLDNANQNGEPSAKLSQFLLRGNLPCQSVQVSSVSKTSSRNTELPAHDETSEKIELLMEIWNSSPYLKEDAKVSEEELSSITRPPHLENCKARYMEYTRMDSRSDDGERPHWSLWKGLLGAELGKHVPYEDDGEELLLNKTALLQGPFPPWIDGGEEDNLPYTRRVQRDLWLHQHPKNCRDSSLKFLYVDFANISTWGTGAQLNAISGMVAVAMNENRVLVLEYFNRADHEGCKGSGHSRWTCYFIPETSKECRERALELAASQEARKNKTITDMSNYWGGITWFAPIPVIWGKPWEHLQATSQVNGELTVHHNQMHIWWWRAQAIRYLTRYPSEYLCVLLNRARHEAFGRAAAALVVDTLPKEWPKVESSRRNITAMEKLVWSNHIHRPWVPRPLVSVHVRQGDKGREMKIFSFKSYMELAHNLRGRFPNAKHIWLSTEMQNVVDESKNYTKWNFYYTNIRRQTGSTTMKDYETGLGRWNSSTNAFVNLMMAVDCDYFIGALGSSWGSIIDGLRSTGGKALAGIVSVNPGQFW
ncbi:uncharacterized protein LOC9652159 [Selaginella moellendorffii]|uniref:uncharacterized protein LOC9652159 n=1 Tax=Selaginella moellendorffii TaxID=88036 RepID=UPI000D1CAC8A|nr:uncharacterized protein LOC9652159 [Selaginella moellendorffii]|eukprot:XP_024526544.1 uncharacterized protein LOC9652159 [Selaginella moellendorffii]